MKHLRPLYEQLGVDQYYRNYGDQYENPHLAEIEALLQQNRALLEQQKVLDFCAGGGEVTRVLQAWGVPEIVGSDPYTHQLYTQQTQLPCHTWSFQQVIRQGLPEQFDAIICSFAMHLCPEEQLYPLCIQLFQASPNLFILTPHKRPQLELLTGVNLESSNWVLTSKGKKVFFKQYSYEFQSAF